MTEELIIQQPQGGSWLNPGKRAGHLVAIMNVRSKEKIFDEMAGRERDVAEFDFVDLDEEKSLITASDNHPGITSRLKVGNPGVVLGRIGFQPSRTPGQKDALVLGTHSPDDAVLMRAWHADFLAGKTWQPANTPVGVPINTYPAPAPVPEPPGTPQPPSPGPVPVPVATYPAVSIADPVPPAPPASPGPTDIDINSLPPETLALIAKAVQQTGASPNGQ